MWVQRVVRVLGSYAAQCARSRACITLHPGIPRVGLFPRVPGVRTFSTHTLDPFDPASSCSEGAAQKIKDEALPVFNINLIVNLLRQENGKDLCVIKLPPEIKYVEYFVIVGGTSSRHLQAMAQYTLKMYKYLKGENKSQICIEGKETDDWMCIDFGKIVVHFMLEETRETYELEKLWTLRSYDDQLSQMVQEILPSDFMFGLEQHKK